MSDNRRAQRHPLRDAIKCPCLSGGKQALLQWGFVGTMPTHSVQMPEAVVNAILRDRNAYIRGGD